MSTRASESGDSRTGVHSPLLGVEARISKDRRRFIVLAVFDFTLLLLLWLICTVSSAGDDLPAAFAKEINIFDAHFLRNSLFDIVLVVCLRMTVLIVCYAALRLSHWLPVAITTGATSIFLIIKVLFFFSHRTSPAPFPQYLLVLSAFIVAWVELWFMPFKVLPRERDAEEAEASSPRSARGTFDRRPVIAFSDDDFRSALEFTTDSEDEDGISSPHRISSSTNRKTKAIYLKSPLHTAHSMTSMQSHPTRTPSPSHRQEPPAQVPPAHTPSRLRFLKAIAEAEGEVTRLETAAVNWRVMRAADPVVKQSEAGAFAVKARIACEPAVLWDAVWKDNLKWNDQVLDAKEVLKIDEKTVLFYSVSAPAMRGYIASRDFLDVRRVLMDAEKADFFGVFVSVDSHLLPPNANKKIIRGVNGPSMMRVSRCPSGGSTLQWIMQTHLNGGLPRRIVQSSMLTFFVNNIARLKQYIDRQTAPAI